MKKLWEWLKEHDVWMTFAMLAIVLLVTELVMKLGYPKTVNLQVPAAEFTITVTLIQGLYNVYKKKSRAEYWPLLAGLVMAGMCFLPG